jgi:hypothetical protein
MSPGWILTLECLVKGHVDLVRHTKWHMYLQCERCGRQTTGWTFALDPSSADGSRTSEASTAGGDACQPAASVPLVGQADSLPS